MKKQYFSILETIGIALLGGLLFLFIHMPLPWLLGPLTVVAIWSLTTRRSLDLPPFVFEIALLILGYMLGSSFTKETALQIVLQLPFMVVTTTLIVLISLGLGVVTARRSKLDLASVVIGSVPGGLAQMLVLSKEIKGIDPTIVLFTQVIRVLAVVFIVPFITLHGIGGETASLPSSPNTIVSSEGQWYQYIIYGLVSISGYFIGKRVGLPTSVLTGPLIATAMVASLWGEAAPPLPSIIIILSQIATGINIGLLVKPHVFKSIKTFGTYTIGGSILLILSSLLIAYGLTMATPMNLATGFLSTAPGGIAEMGITASMIGADISTVSGYQLFRILFILLVISPVLQRWLKKKEDKNLKEKQSS